MFKTRTFYAVLNIVYKLEKYLLKNGIFNLVLGMLNFSCFVLLFASTCFL